MYKTQKQQVLEKLLKARRPVPMTTFVYSMNITRFWARLLELRKEWYEIQTIKKWVKKGKQTQLQTSYRLMDYTETKK